MRIQQDDFKTYIKIRSKKHWHKTWKYTTNNKLRTIKKCTKVLHYKNKKKTNDTNTTSNRTYPINPLISPYINRHIKMAKM